VVFSWLLIKLLDRCFKLTIQLRCFLHTIVVGLTTLLCRFYDNRLMLFVLTYHSFTGSKKEVRVLIIIRSFKFIKLYIVLSILLIKVR